MAGTLEIEIEEVVAAGRVLFGPGFAADGAGWRDALRTTYRRRALETHPDRARALGRSEAELAREFHRVAEAYRVLSALCAGPVPRLRRRGAASPPPPRPRPAAAPGARSGPPPRPRTSARTAAPSRPAASASRTASGSRAASSSRPVSDARTASAPGSGQELPQRRLRFAEFLYYSGRVPFTAFVDAIAWQRRQRPPVGRIAVDWGFLTDDEVREVLDHRRAAGAHAIPFGEYAVRLGYLTSHQLLALLGRQLRLQRRIGEFFVERGYLRDGEVDALRWRIARHNVRWPR